MHTALWLEVISSKLAHQGSHEEHEDITNLQMFVCMLSCLTHSCVNAQRPKTVTTFSAVSLTLVLNHTTLQYLVGM